MRREPREREQIATTERGRKRAREVHSRSSARGPSDRTLIPFKGEARRRYAVVHHVGERGEQERGRGEGRGTEKRERERQVEAGSIASRFVKEDRRRMGLCGGETRGGERGRVERGTLFAERSR